MDMIRVVSRGRSDKRCWEKKVRDGIKDIS